MDIDNTKSYTTEEHHHHFDIMTMMMQMEKLPQDFCSPQHNLSAMPEIDFPCSVRSQPIFQNHDVALSSPIMINQQVQDNIPFMAVPSVQEPVTPPLQQGRFRPAGSDAFASQYDKKNSVAAMREMIFRIAVMQPIHIDPESVKPPKRRNVKISKDPQSVAARHRRERISERIRILQRLVPGGTKMDTASMLDEAIHYVKFLKKQVQTLEQATVSRPLGGTGYGFPATAMGKLHQSGYLKASEAAHMGSSISMQMIQ